MLFPVRSLILSLDDKLDQCPMHMNQLAVVYANERENIYVSIVDIADHLTYS